MHVISLSIINEMFFYLLEKIIRIHCIFLVVRVTKHVKENKKSDTSEHGRDSRRRELDSVSVAECGGRTHGSTNTVSPR